MADSTPLPGASQDTGPLDWRIAITDQGGRPTPEFQRRWATQRNNNNKIGTTVGHGPPQGVPDSDGLTYVDEDTTPFTMYVSEAGQWVQVGVVKFTDLSDVPHSYTTFASEVLRVNGAATGVEFATVSQLLDSIGAVQGDVLYRGSTGWQALAPGTSGFVLSTGGTGANPSWVAQSGGVTAFTGLSDVPHSYTGAGGRLVRVNAGATGLEFITLTSELDTLGSTQGSILYRNGTVWTPLTPGTAGQVLTTGGAGANPSWATGSGGSGAGYTYAEVPSSGSGYNTGAFATKGNTIRPTSDITISRVFAPFNAVTAGHVVRMSIVSISTPLTSPVTISAVLGTATVTSPPSGFVSVFTLATPVTLTAGQNYAILFTDTNAATSTTSIGLLTAGTACLWSGAPTDIISGGNTATTISCASLNPVAGTTWTGSVGAGFYMMLELLPIGLGPATPTGTANLVYATPNGSSGAASLRSLAGPDLPNPSASTLGGVQSKTATTHQFLTSISTSGVPVAAQPATTDLSDVVDGGFTWSDNSGAALAINNNGGAFYDRIGDMVFTFQHLTYPTTVDTNLATITGLPFTVAGGTKGYAAMSIVYIDGVPAASGTILAAGLPGSNTIYFYYANGGANVLNSTLSGRNLYFQFGYSQ